MMKLSKWSRVLAVFGTLTAPLASAQAPGQEPGGPGNGAVNACEDPVAEENLKRRETALLGAGHANDHANTRAHHCKVLKGGMKAPKPDKDALAVALTNPTSAVGAWSNPFVIPVAGVTAVVLHTGKVLFWSYEPTTFMNPKASNTGVAYLWDPVTRAGSSIAPPENIWCSGQTILSDGRVFLAGGNLRYPDPSAPAGQTGWAGALSSYTFNPGNSRWTRQPDMANGRWYPTLTKIADARVVINSGYDETGSQAINQAVEVFVPPSAAEGVGTMSAVAIHNSIGTYPFQFLMPSGKVLQAGPGSSNTVLLTPQTGPGTWSVSTVPHMRSQHYSFGNGVSVTDASGAQVKQLVMIAGGNSSTAVGSNNEWLDGMNPAGGWKAYPQWLQARHNANTVVLPDGSLFTVGGNSALGTYESPLFHAELYNKSAEDTTGQWIRVASNTIPAAYHSSAVLLPDATVLLSEDDRSPAQASKHTAQVYSPPYLFRGARPVIVSGPGAVAGGNAYSYLTDGGRKIIGVTMVAPGAVTHANDMHQRLVKLPYVQKGREIQITVPSSKSLLPPGYYMLFVINDKGIPSVAKFVRVS